MSLILKNLESSPAKAATVTAPFSCGNTEDCNAVCVDVIDHGEVDTPWGLKPRVSLVFETDLLDDSRKRRFITRTFNNSNYVESALTKTIKGWLQIDISKEKFDLKELVGEPASLEVHQATSSSNRLYLKIESIDPAGASLISPSGEYRRRDDN
jgi:hypothetical protein